MHIAYFEVVYMTTLIGMFSTVMTTFSLSAVDSGWRIFSNSIQTAIIVNHILNNWPSQAYHEEWRNPSLYQSLNAT